MKSIYPLTKCPFTVFISENIQTWLSAQWAITNLYYQTLIWNRRYISIGWFLKRFYLVFLGSSWFPRKQKILLEKAKTKSHFWASFHNIWSMSKSSKLDTWKAISAKKITIWKLFLRKNKYYNVVVPIPNFYLPAWSSSFFLAFFLHVYGESF